MGVVQSGRRGLIPGCFLLTSDSCLLTPAFYQVQKATAGCNSA